MKKTLILTALLALSASASFAGGTSGATGTIDFANTGQSLTGDAATATADTALIGKCSTGVDMAWNTSANGYALMTQHKSGTKAYGTSYDSTAVYQSVATDTEPGTPAYNSGALTATDTTDFADDTVWKTM
jgi:hypothetical protein